MEPLFAETKNKEQEIVILCGSPASGKSFFAKNYLLPHGFKWVNQDTLKTKEKCLKATKEFLAQGHSVVVDNTNPKVEVRAEYVKLAKANDVPIRCFYLTTPLGIAKHLNMYRENVTKGAQPHVPRVAFAVFKKSFQKPLKSEGFSEVREIEFTVESLDEGQKKLFFQITASAK